MDGSGSIRALAITSAGGGGTSIAAPHIAGAAANLKHLLIDLFGTSSPNVVGNLYANMLLMGDLATGPTTFGTGIDSRWGAGRMRTRMWDPAGMDSPHRMRSVVLDHAGSATILVNPDSNGDNQVLSADVDRLRVAVWWFEPNLGTTPIPETPALILTDLSRQTAPGTVATIMQSSTDIATQRLGSSAPGGFYWTVVF